MYAKTTSANNDLMIVISNEDVPFPTPWNTNDPAIPNGTNIKKKQNILSANAIWGVRYAVAAEYENSNAICGAKINVRAPKIYEITNPNLILYVKLVFNFS